MAAGDGIPVAPTGPGPSGGLSGGGSGSGSGSGTRRTGGRRRTGGGSRSGGGGGGGASSAERRMIARENEAKRKAAAKYIRQAKTLDEQAQALKKALNSGFKRALDIRLANVGRIQRQQDATLVEGYRARVGSLKDSAEDNQKAEAAQTFANLGNRGRERANAVSEAMNQGAGESDLLRSQQMSLRNWNHNQAEVNRGFWDSLRSVNSSLNDLNVDTKTARMNIANESNADREQLYNSYYAQRSEAYTNLGNIRGQQAELYGLANEAVGSRKTRRRLNQAENMMGSSFDNATRAISQAWRNPGASKALQNWQGRDDFEGTQNMSVYRNAQTDIAPQRPEGATLRAWSQ